MTTFKEKLQHIEKYCKNINHEVTETYQLLLELHRYRDYISSELLLALEQEINQAYDDIICEEFDFEETNYDAIYDAVHVLVDAMTENLTEEEDYDIRERLTEQFRFYRRKRV